MSSTIVGQGTRYSETGAAENGTSVTGYATGSTAEEPFTVSIGRLMVRAETQKEVNDFMAWLSNMSGKPVDKLTALDVLRHVKISELSGNIFGYDPVEKKTFTSFSVKETRWDSIDDFNKKQLFGEEIPSFPAGSGSFFGASLDLSKPNLGLDAGLAGFMGTAQLIYNSNYPATKKLPVINMEQLNPAVKGLLQRMFGPGRQFDQGHLNVLKMMNLLTGTADQPVSSWALSAGVGAPLLQSYEDNPQVFVAAVSLFNMKDKQLSQAKGVSGYFDAGGNFASKPEGPSFGVSDVEKVAIDLLEAMSPPASTLPASIKLGERVRNMLNALFSLDPANGTFSVEQVNAAIAMNLLKLDIKTSSINLSGNGKGYLEVKNPTEVDDTTKLPDQPKTREQYLQALWTGWEYLLNNHGTHMADFLEAYHDDGNKNGEADDNNDRFGWGGIEELTRLTTDSFFWQKAGKHTLSEADRKKIIDTAADLLKNPLFFEQWEVITKINGGSGYKQAITENQLKIWLSDNKDTWRPNIEQFKTRFHDTKVTPSGIVTAHSIGPAHFDISEWEAMNKICQQLFGKKFDQMTDVNEKRKALYVLSTGPNPFITLNEFEVEGDDWEASYASLNVDFTQAGTEYTNSLG